VAFKDGVPHLKTKPYEGHIETMKISKTKKEEDAQNS
jgi:hypothetical protein